MLQCKFGHISQGLMSKNFAAPYNGHYTQYELETYGREILPFLPPRNMKKATLKSHIFYLLPQMKGTTPTLQGTTIRYIIHKHHNHHDSSKRIPVRNK